MLGWSEANKSLTHAVFFGWNVLPCGEGMLAIGDAVEVMEHDKWEYSDRSGSAAV